MRIWGLVLALLALAAGAGAHFAQGSKPRTIIVAEAEVEAEGGIEAFVRVPAPLLFADVVADVTARQVPFAHPFVRVEREGPTFRHRLALGAIEADLAAWEARLAGALAWRSGDLAVPAEVRSWRVVGRDPIRGFATAAEARASLASDGAQLDPVLGDAVVELALVLDAPAAASDLEVRAALPPLPLPPGVAIDNHLRDERGRTASLDLEGQLEVWAAMPEPAGPLERARRGLLGLFDRT